MARKPKQNHEAYKKLDFIAITFCKYSQLTASFKLGFSIMPRSLSIVLWRIAKCSAVELPE